MKACIFDLDGTIIYTIESLRYSLSKALEIYDYPPVTEEETARFIGNGVRLLVKRGLEKYGDTDPEHFEVTLARYTEIFRQNCTRGNKSYDGLTEALKEAKAMGFQLGVISNKPDERTRDCVYKVYGRDLFEAVYGERPGIPLKPDPAGLLDVMQRMGVTGDETLYFGDTDMDMNAGNAAGCHTVAVCWGYRSEECLREHAPEYVIHHPSDIPGLLRKVRNEV